MNLIERIKEITKHENLTREEFSEKTGIKYTRLQTVLNGRGRVGSEELDLIEKVFPEYGYWLAYGKELPEAGQISPATKAIQKDYRSQGEAG